MANKFSYLYSLHMNKISEDYDIYANRLFIPTPVENTITLYYVDGIIFIAFKLFQD